MSGLEVGATSTCNLDGAGPRPGSNVFALTIFPLTREMLDMCRYCVYCFGWMWKRGSRQLVQPYSPRCRHGWTLDTDDFGLLVLSTLVNEVSMCTNSGSKRPLRA